MSGGGLAAPRTTHGIAHAWLTAHGIANTNDSVETQDPDADGRNNLQEYVAGTDPTNRASCFYMYLTNSAGSVVAWFPSVPASGSDYVGKARYYDLEGASNLPAAGVWRQIAGYNGIPGDGRLVGYTNATPEGLGFYRAKVWQQ